MNKINLVINLDDKFGLFKDHWRPKVIAELNGQEVKIIKAEGEFPWHRHEREDEFFLVWKGTFRVEFRDRIVVWDRAIVSLCQEEWNTGRVPLKRPASCASSRRGS